MGIFAGFAGFGRQRDFRDGGDGEPDRPAGPRHAWDSRRGGRPRCWGGTRRASTRAQAVPAGFTARAPSGKESSGVSKRRLNQLSGEVLKTHVIY
jgi:hypothetical protein